MTYKRRNLGSHPGNQRGPFNLSFIFLVDRNFLLVHKWFQIKSLLSSTTCVCVCHGGGVCVGGARSRKEVTDCLRVEAFSLVGRTYIDSCLPLTATIYYNQKSGGTLGPKSGFEHFGPALGPTSLLDFWLCAFGTQIRHPIRYIQSNVSRLPNSTDLFLYL